MSEATDPEVTAAQLRRWLRGCQEQLAEALHELADAREGIRWLKGVIRKLKDK